MLKVTRQTPKQTIPPRKSMRQIIQKLNNHSVTTCNEEALQPEINYQKCLERIISQENQKPVRKRKCQQLEASSPKRKRQATLHPPASKPPQSHQEGIRKRPAASHTDFSQVEQCKKRKKLPRKTITIEKEPDTAIPKDTKGQKTSLTDCVPAGISGAPKSVTRSLRKRAIKEAIPLETGPKARLYTKTSTISGAGLGLFAGKTFQPKEFITWYDGDIQNATESDLREVRDSTELCKWSHVATVGKHRIIHGLQAPIAGRGGGSFINDNHDPMTAYNAQLYTMESTLDPRTPQGRELYIQATKKISPGEEIFMPYGRDYWKHFHDSYPDAYEEIFEPQFLYIKQIKQALKKSINEDSGRLCSVLGVLKDTPVIQYEELKDIHKNWDAHNCRYALYRAGLIGIDKMMLTTIRLLKPESDAYFELLGRYVCYRTSQIHDQKKQSEYAKDIAGQWNSMAIRGRGENKKKYPLCIPKNGLFNDDDTKWTTGHIQVFYCFYGASYFNLDAKRMVFVIKALNKNCAMYRALMKQYIMRELDLKEGECIDFTNLSIQKKQNMLMNYFVKREYLSLPMSEGEFVNNCTRDNLKKYLIQEGFTVQTSDTSYASSIPYFLNRADNEQKYKTALTSICQQYDYDLSYIVKPRDYQQFEGKQGITFRPLDGFEHQEEFCDKHTLFMQYIHLFGFDCPEIYPYATTKTLNILLRKMKPDYRHPTKGNMLAQEFIALVFSRHNGTDLSISRLKPALKELRHLLPPEMREKPDALLIKELMEQGHALHEKYSQAPSALNQQSNA